MGMHPMGDAGDPQAIEWQRRQAEQKACAPYTNEQLEGGVVPVSEIPELPSPWKYEGGGLAGDFITCRYSNASSSTNRHPRHKKHCIYAMLKKRRKGTK